MTAPGADPDRAGKRLGREPLIAPDARVREITSGAYCEIGARARVAERSIGDLCRISNDSDLIHTTPGRFWSIAAQVRSNPGKHPMERVAMNHFPYRSSAYGLGGDEVSFFDGRRAAPVTLGNDVWGGHGAVILPEVTIGDGAVVGAGAVVSRDVPPFAIAAVVPARDHRLRFAAEVVAALRRITWWDWPRERLRGALADIRGLSAEEFCARCDRR